ncbi:MAG: outer membrane beta-barrel protein [Hyphomicrobiaceae bacterium]
MTTNRSFILGLALAVGGAIAPAGAADLYTGMGSLKDGYYAAPSMARWYLRGDLGYAFHGDEDVSVEIGGISYDSITAEMEDTWTVGGGVGVYFSENFRGDVTIDYRTDAGVDGVADDWTQRDYSFDLSSTVVLANLYYDFNRGGGFTPYVGAGIGWVNHQTSNGLWGDNCGCNGTIEGKSTDDMAAALMAGFTVDFGHEGGGSIKDGPVADSRGVKLDVGYRYLWLGDAHTGDMLMNGTVAGGDPIVHDLDAHEFRVGLRYDIY